MGVYNRYTCVNSAVRIKGTLYGGIGRQEQLLKAVILDGKALHEENAARSGNLLLYIMIKPNVFKIT
jgi:hypothetical protein